ncbi:targeting protein for Xklp2 [Pungitius pungitius]|uniref:targeting protein for Xklp2 n=1 Tax=Pungitius pungitius TaxID=134920 RepID=UPI002E114FF3
MSESGSRDRYEFDAPSHVVDLVDLENAEGDDVWFEKQAGAADGHLKTPVVPPHVKTREDSGPSTSTSPPPNIVTSWGAGSPARTGSGPKRSAAVQPPAKPRRVSKRREMSSSAAPPPLKKHRKTPVGQRSCSVLGRKVQQKTRTASKARPSASSATANTEPNSSEEQELQRIRNLQKEVALHRKQNEASYKAALAGNPPPKKMAMSATVPKEFHFNTSAKAAAASHAAHKEVDFMSQLRKPSCPTKAMRGATVPKPFNLSTGHKREAEESTAYVPMAQAIAQFQKRTPDRYHLRSRRSQERGPAAVKGDKLKLTQPHTPHLMTRQRSRPTTVKSSEELEAEELDKLHKFKFNASELNRKILQSAEHLKRPAVKEPTVPEGFELQIDKRLHERQAARRPQEEEEEEKVHTFKAQRLPKRILEGVVGLPEKKVLHPTVPESPAFALKKRIRLERVEEVKQPSPIKPPPVPHFGLPFQPQLQENHNVEVCPFSFDERDRERRVLKEKKLLELRNEEVPQFKAQPLPDFDAVLLPEKKKIEPTKPEPFRLLLDERGTVRSTRLEQMGKGEEAVVFKARPNTVTHKEPFQPKKEARTRLVVEAFELSTERRALERQEFEQQAIEKEALRMRMEEEQRREQEQKEKEEITRMRQEQVHCAQPIRHYKTVAVKKSEVPLTVPHSPNFSDRFRL